MREIAIRIRQEIAGEDFHGSEEYEKHRRAAKRLGPKAHLLYLATCHRDGTVRLTICSEEPCDFRWRFTQDRRIEGMYPVLHLAALRYVFFGVRMGADQPHLYGATRNTVNSVYFETRQADTADYIRDCFRDDLEIRSRVLETECASFYAKPEKPADDKKTAAHEPTE
jgi:hypothetical protein